MGHEYIDACATYGAQVQLTEIFSSHKCCFDVALFENLPCLGMA